MPQRAFGQQRMEALIAQTDREKEDLARRKEAEAKQIREEAEQAVSCLGVGDGCRKKNAGPGAHMWETS